MEKGIDRKTFESLVRNTGHFAQVLGEPRRTGAELCFPGGGLAFPELKIRYEVVKKFLGKIYAMVLEAHIVPHQQPPGPIHIELRYSGIVRAGKPLFVLSGQTRSPCAEKLTHTLNTDESLIERCGRLDLEYLEVRFDHQQEVWEVRLRPYGGSHVHLLVPPMRYNVMLPKEQAEIIIPVMNRIVELVRQTGDNGRRI